METFPMTCYENLKRYWRRKKYQKLYGSNSNNKKRKIKIARLGAGLSSPRRQWKISLANTTTSSQTYCLKRIFSPKNMMTKFHETYVNMISHLAGSVAHKSSGSGAFSKNKVVKTKQISIVSDELVDSKLVLEIYKRLAASRQMDSLLY